MTLILEFEFSALARKDRLIWSNSFKSLNPCLLVSRNNTDVRIFIQSLGYFIGCTDFFDKLLKFLWIVGFIFRIKPVSRLVRFYIGLILKNDRLRQPR